MKKAFVLAILSITTFLSSCSSAAAKYGGGIVVHGSLPSPTNIAAYYAKEDIVYVTKSGKKYHKEGCPYLKSSKIMISLQQALMEGMKPCSKCFGENNDD